MYYNCSIFITCFLFPPLYFMFKLCLLRPQRKFLQQWWGDWYVDVHEWMNHRELFCSYMSTPTTQIRTNRTKSNEVTYYPGVKANTTDFYFGNRIFMDKYSMIGHMSLHILETNLNLIFFGKIRYKIFFKRGKYKFGNWFHVIFALVHFNDIWGFKFGSYLDTLIAWRSQRSSKIS